jgi:hypothetical protein
MGLLAVELVPSPKSHNQAVGPTEVSVKITEIPFIIWLKFATGIKELVYVNGDPVGSVIGDDVGYTFGNTGVYVVPGVTDAVVGTAVGYTFGDIVGYGVTIAAGEEVGTTTVGYTFGNIVGYVVAGTV